MFATNVSNSSHSTLSQSFFRPFRRAKLSITYSHFSTAATTDSKARPRDTAELRSKAIFYLYIV